MRLLEIIRDNPSLKIYEIKNIASNLDSIDYHSRHKMNKSFGILMESGLVRFELDVESYCTHSPYETYHDSSKFDENIMSWLGRAADLQCRNTEFGKEILKQYQIKPSE